MNGNIFNIKPFAVHDGPGIRTTIFLKGCSLKCRWCHNPEGISSERQLSWLEHKCVHCGVCVTFCPRQAHVMENGRHAIRRERCTACGVCVGGCFAEALKIYGDSVPPEELAKIVVRDKAFFDNSGGGLTVSGGEPLLQAGFVAELFGIVKPQGIHTAVDTSGAVPRAAVERVMPLTDLFLYDLKQADPKKHLEGTGAGNRRIIENLFFISDQGKAVEIRIPLVPGYNDSEADLRSSAEILRKVKSLTRVVLLPYRDYAKTKYAALEMGDTMPRAESPADEDLRRAAGTLQSFGINAVSGKD